MSDSEYNRNFNDQDYERFLKCQFGEYKNNNNALVHFAHRWLIKNIEYREKLCPSALSFLRDIILISKQGSITSAKKRKVVSLLLAVVINPFLDQFLSYQNVPRRLRVALKNAHRKNCKGSSITKNLPYTIKQLMMHLENQFQEGMTWRNYGWRADCWNIDHIYPKSRLAYDSVDHPNFQKCWSLKNLRPMWTIDNLAKSNSILDE